MAKERGTKGQGGAAGGGSASSDRTKKGTSAKKRLPVKPQMLRRPNDLLRDSIWPDQGGVNIDFDESVRHRAVMWVLLTMPLDDYEILTRRIDEFVWFIPHEHLLGEIRPFVRTNEGRPTTHGFGLAPYAAVLYLSPVLEQVSMDVAVAVVAHELAHIVLAHPIQDLGPEEYEANEEEAWERVEKWGFEKEAKAHEAWHEKAEEASDAE